MCYVIEPPNHHGIESFKTMVKSIVCVIGLSDKEQRGFRQSNRSVGGNAINRGTRARARVCVGQHQID